MRIKYLPNTKIKIIAGKHKNEKSIVKKQKGNIIFLKNLFYKNMQKKMHNLKIHISNIVKIS